MDDEAAGEHAGTNTNDTTKESMMDKPLGNATLRDMAAIGAYPAILNLHQNMRVEEVADITVRAANALLAALAQAEPATEAKPEPRKLSAESWTQQGGYGVHLRFTGGDHVYLSRREVQMIRDTAFGGKPEQPAPSADLVFAVRELLDHHGAKGEVFTAPAWWDVLAAIIKRVETEMPKDAAP